MKKLTSIIIALTLLLSMFSVVAGAQTPGTSQTKQPVFSQTAPLAASNDSEYFISEFTKEDADKVSGEILGYMGDVDGDSDVSIMDATEIQLAAASLIALDDIRAILADVDQDGDASVIDVTEIQLYVAQLSTSDVIGHILYTPVVEFDPEKYAYVKVDDEYYMVTGKDKTFTYTAYLASDAKISSLDASVMYDSSGIEYIPCDDEKILIPNLKSPVCNDMIDGQFIYNFTYYKGVTFPIPENDDMDYDNILFTGQFKVTADTGVYEISHFIKVLGGPPNIKIIYNYKKVNDEVTVITDNELTGLYHIDKSLISQPTERPTEKPTERPTEKPTEKPTEAWTEPNYPTEAPLPTESYPDYPDYPEASPDQPDYPDYPYDFPYYPRTYGNTISFDASTTGWNNYRYISFHIWEYGGDAFYSWGGKGARGTDSDGDNIWTYDLDAKGITLRPNTLYAVIFYNDWSAQTYDLLFTTDCIGDTAFCTDVSLENPVDCTKTSQAAFWSRKDPTVLGPVKEITSIGNVVGTCIPSTTSALEMFEDFLENTLENARTYSDKSDQRILDDVAYLLGLDASKVQTAIRNTGVRVNWSSSNSYLDGAESDSPVNPSSPSQAFDAIKKHLNNNPVWEYDYGIDYEVELSYNSGNNSIIISGVDYSSTRVVRTYIRIMRGDRVFYYETEMENDVTGAVYFDATGYGSIASTKPLSFYTERATFSSSSYTYSQAEPIITDGFAKALAVADYALGGNVNCSIYDLL